MKPKRWDGLYGVYAVWLRLPAGRGVYVGSTCWTPAQRFRQHRAGYKASRWVFRYGVRLAPTLAPSRRYASRARAERVEREIARELKARGYRVHQN